MIEPSKQTGFKFVGRPLFSTACIVLGLGFLGGCAAPAAVQAPLAALHLPVGLESNHSQHIGTILSGPQVGDFDLDRHVICTVETVLLRQAPGQFLSPLASDLRLVAQLKGRQTVQGGSRLAVGARWAYGES
ncbi:MAG: hypothetical protein JKY61_11590, partial [Planctomycetes bacterium]|nr:hypothetical protein [Planctomycetota bacterium]